MLASFTVLRVSSATSASALSAATLTFGLFEAPPRHSSGKTVYLPSFVSVYFTLRLGLLAQQSLVYSSYFCLDMLSYPRIQSQPHAQGIDFTGVYENHLQVSMRNRHLHLTNQITVFVTTMI